MVRPLRLRRQRRCAVLNGDQGGLLLGHGSGELSSGLVAASGQRRLELGGRLGGLRALVLVDRFGLLASSRRLPIGMVEDLVGLALGVFEDPGRLGVGLGPDVLGVAVGVGTGGGRGVLRRCLLYTSRCV